MKHVGLIVSSDDGVAIFGTIAAAEQYLEAQDVEANVYPIAFDPEGRIYKLEASGITTWNGGRVRISATEEIDQTSLRELLARNASPPAGPETTLNDLVSAFSRRIIA